MKLRATLFSLFSILVFASNIAYADTKVVFLTGDDEYRSEESMPMIAKILERDFGFETVVGFSLDENGHVAPAATTSMTEADELVDADLLVMFLRFRRPDPETFQYILDYLAEGKPVVAFRTSTHAFRFAHDAKLDEWGFQNDPDKIHSLAGGEKVRELLGQGWITHHGHFDDGLKPLTEVSVREGKSTHPILKGFQPFPAYSWLYHVEGPEHSLAGNPDILLDGTSLKSKKEMDNQTEMFPLTNPIAWTKTHKGLNGKTGRVFMTTLGHPYDFRDANMRRLTLQGMLWALGKEDLIPEGGVKTDVEGSYEPNNSGFGDTYKQGLTPEMLTGE